MQLVANYDNDKVYGIMQSYVSTTNIIRKQPDFNYALLIIDENPESGCSAAQVVNMNIKINLEDITFLPLHLTFKPGETIKLWFHKSNAVIDNTNLD